MARLDQLKPQRRNANKHTPRGMGALEKSIQEDGWIGAITVAADGETFDGSARIEVGAAAGFEDVIVVESDGSKPVVVKRVDIPTTDDPRAVRLGVAANRVAQIDLDWDVSVLASLAEETDLSGLFRDEELAELLAGVDQPDIGGGGDDFDTTLGDGSTRTQVGDLWAITGNGLEHRLIVGDCTDSAVLTRLMDGQRAALCLTDPPYGISLENHDASGHRSNRSFAIASDDSQDAGFVILAWCVAENLPTVVFADPMLPWPGAWRQHLVWNKGGAVGGGGDTARCWKQSWELIQIARTPILSGGRDEAVLEYRVSSHLSADHVAAKPVELIAYLMEKTTPRNALVVDPFLGSGTTLIAGHRLGRTVYGCEIDPKYADLSLARCEAAGLSCTRVEP
jgi:hypothetical protein